MSDGTAALKRTVERTEEIPLELFEAAGTVQVRFADRAAGPIIATLETNDAGKVTLRRVAAVDPSKAETDKYGRIVDVSEGPEEPEERTDERGRPTTEPMAVPGLDGVYATLSLTESSRYTSGFITLRLTDEDGERLMGCNLMTLQAFEGDKVRLSRIGGVNGRKVVTEDGRSFAKV